MRLCWVELQHGGTFLAPENPGSDLCKRDVLMSQRLLVHNWTKLSHFLLKDISRETRLGASVSSVVRGHRPVSMAKGGWGSCVSPDMLELLPLSDGCGVSRALEEGVKHRECEEKPVLGKDRSKVPRGIVRFQVGAGFKLGRVFISITGRKADFR